MDTMQLPSRQRSVAGITLIELLIVVAITGIVASIAVPSYRQYVLRTQNARAKSDIVILSLQIERYYDRQWAFPATLDDIGGAPLDPWGTPYQYLVISSKTKGKGGGKSTGGGTSTPDNRIRKDKNLHPLNSDYDLYSMGADRRSQAPLTASVSRDDIIRAGNGTFIGLAADY
jgi:general secretion pathway protein G